MKREDQWLIRYRTSRTEADFRRIVDSYLGQVLSVAERVLRNPELAKDVAQEVFTRLARRPEKVPKNLPLAVWLHRTTHSAAVDLVRSEEARRRHENTAAKLDAMKEPVTDWDQLSPIIDRALDELEAEDRIAVVLRFFRRQSHAEIGQVLGIGSDAARMRVKRALERLRISLGRKGVTVSSAVLATALPAHASVAVPASLVASISSTAVTSAAIPVTTSLSALLSTFTMNLKTIVFPTICVALVAVSSWQRKEIIEQKAILQAVAQTETSIGMRSRSGIDRPRRASARSQGGSTLRPRLAEAKAIAALEPLATREAKLLEWATRFETSEQILALAADLRDADELPPLLRTRLAEALTTRWAQIDFAEALAAQATAALLSKSSPYGEVLADSETGLHLLDRIAAVDPKAFASWVGSNDDLMADLITGEWSSDATKELLAQSEDLAEAHRGTRSPLDAGDGLGQALVRHAPFGILTALAKIPPEKTIMPSIPLQLLGESLVDKAREVDEVWARVPNRVKERLSDTELRALVTGVFEADRRPASTILAGIQSTPTDQFTSHRLEQLGRVLTREMEALPPDDFEAEDQWWTAFENYGNTLNSDIYLADSQFDDARRRMAILGTDHDVEAGLAWAEALTAPDIRSNVAIEVALRANGMALPQRPRTVPGRENLAESESSVLLMATVGLPSSARELGLSETASAREIYDGVNRHLQATGLDEIRKQWDTQVNSTGVFEQTRNLQTILQVLRRRHEKP